MPHAVDLHVGKRILLRRRMLGVTQQELGAMLGVSFQQIQKYERASNRVSASRLHHIAKVLNVPVGFFFDGCEETAAPRRGDPLYDTRNLHLIATLNRLSPRQQDRLIALAEVIGE